jgi:histone deacetylase 1/2
MLLVRLWDKSKQHETELSDSEDEGTGGRRHRQSHKDATSNGTGSRRKRKSQSPSSRSRPGSTATPAPAEAVPANGDAAATTTAAPIVTVGDRSLASGSLAAGADAAATPPPDIKSWASGVGRAPASEAVDSEGDVEMKDAEATPSSVVGQGGAGGPISGPGAGDVFAEGA